MSISTAKEFIAVLTKSRLLKPKHLDAVRSAADKAPDPKALAGRLVKKELLSRWQAKQLLAGHTSFFLGAYRLIEPLSHHSGSHVYLAEHKTLGRRVVLKRLPREVMGDDDRKNRLLGAVRALVGLDHENLARVYSIEQAGDRYYVISQYVEGRDLAATVAEGGPLGFADAVAAVSQAAAGLAEAHRREAVHGGVRPSNLVRTPEGQLKLVAAGTARRFEEASSEADVPDTSAVLDAVQYQAPELLKPDADPAPASDIYSLGCTLYFLLTGKPPFAEGTAAEIAQGHARHQPPGILRARSDTPDLLVKACRKMLSKRPEDRPGTAEEVVEILAELSLPKRSTARIVAAVSAGGPQGGAPAKAEAKGDSAERLASKEKPKPGSEQTERPKAAATDAESDSEPSAEKKPAVVGKDKPRPAGAPPKNDKTVPDAKSPERPQPAKAAPAAAKPAPKRKPARNAKEQDEATSPAKASGRKAKSPKSGAAFAVDLGDEASPTARVKSRAGKGKPSAETAAAGEGSPGFFRKHGKLLAIGGGSLALLLLVAAISLPFVLGGSSAARPEPQIAQAEPEQESQTQKPARSAVDDVIDDLNLEGDLDLDIDDLVGDAPPRQPPSEPEPEEQPDADDEPEEQPPADDEDEPSDPGEPSEPEEPTEPDDEGGENEPAEPEEPKETPPEKPDPPKKEKPPTFRDFPEQVVLPSPGGENGQPAPTEPINLGKLYVRERAPWVVNLRGGDVVAANAEITLARDTAEGGGRTYLVQLTPTGGETTPIARLRYVPEADQLTFQWLESAAESPAAGLLRLCLLDLTIDGESKPLSLSKPKPAPPLEFDLDRTTQNVTIEADDMPDGKLLRLEVTEVEGPVERYETQPKEPIEARKPLALAFQRMDRHRNPQMTALLRINFSTSRKGLTVTRTIAEPKRRLVRPGPQLEMAKQQALEQKKKIEAQLKKADHRTQKEAIQKQLFPVEQGLAHLDLVENVDKQAKIHYRIFLRAGAHELPLFDSKIAGPAEGAEP